MKVRLKVQPTGYISIDGGPLAAWPKAGSVVELPDVVAEDLIKSGRAEKTRATKDDAPEEKRSGEKSEEKPEEKVETRPATTAGEERRPSRPAAAKKGPAGGA